jgi:hypothetical protein
VDGELRELYGLGDDDLSGDQEIDLDLVWDEDEEDREVMVKVRCCDCLFVVCWLVVVVVVCRCCWRRHRLC